MSDIKQAAEQLPEPTKSVTKALIEFYETMKKLETDPHRGGKQATKIVMTCSDIEGIFKTDEREPDGYLSESGGFFYPSELTNSDKVKLKPVYFSI